MYNKERNTFLLLQAQREQCRSLMTWLYITMCICCSFMTHSCIFRHLTEDQHWMTSVWMTTIITFFHQPCIPVEALSLHVCCMQQLVSVMYTYLPFKVLFFHTYQLILLCLVLIYDKPSALVCFNILTFSTSISVHEGAEWCRCWT